MENTLLLIVVMLLVLILLLVAATLYLLLKGRNDQPRLKNEVPFAQIHEAYLKRDGVRYTALSRRALGEAHRLLPAECIVRQAELIQYASAHGFDGLESLWLMYQDCAAASHDPYVRKQRVENARSFNKAYHYKGEAAPQLPHRVARWNSLMERAVRGEALRVLLAHFAKLRPEDSGHMNHADLLAQRAVRAELCGLPLRPNQHGAVALSEILRHGQCLLQGVSGGTFGVKQLCRTLSAGEEREMAALAAMSSEELDSLRAFCEGRAAGAGLSGVGMDALDSFSSDLCVMGNSNDMAQFQSVGQLMADCYSSDSAANPFADDASDRLGTGGEETPTEETPTEETPTEETPTEETPTEGEGVAEWQIAVLDDILDVIYISPERNVYAQLEPLDPDYPGASFDSAQLEIEEQVDTYGDTNVEPTKDNTTVWDYGHDTGIPGKRNGVDAESSPDEFGGSFDPSNPACQQLTKMGLLTGGRTPDFWNQLFGRGPYHVGGAIDPSPDAPDADPGAAELACGPADGGSLAGAHCSSVELCAEGTVLDENCHCVAATSGTLKPGGCFDTHCPEGTTPVPVEVNQCVCSSDAPEEVIDVPESGPGPDPMADPRSELLWNRTANDGVAR